MFVYRGNLLCTFAAKYAEHTMNGQDADVSEKVKVGLSLNGHTVPEISKQKMDIKDSLDENSKETKIVIEIIEDPWTLPELADTSTPWKGKEFKRNNRDKSVLLVSVTNIYELKQLINSSHA